MNLFIDYAWYLDYSPAKSQIDHTDYGGTGTNNLLRQTGVDGIELRTAWRHTETALGVYDFTYLESNLTKALGWGKKGALSLNTTAYYPSEPYSYAPDYIRADSATYGANGGQLQSTPTDGNSQYNTVNMWNANVFNRFKAWIDALAVQFNGRIEYVIFGEMCTQITAAEVAAVGGKAAIAAKQLEIYDYIQSKFTGTTVFIAMNYLSGTAPTKQEVYDNLNYHKTTGRTGAAELAFPTSNQKFPNYTPSISNAHLDATHAILKTFPASQRRYCNTERNGSTMADVTSAYQCRQALRWAAEMLQGCTNPIYRITITDGLGEGLGTGVGNEWKAIGGYIKSRYLR